MALIKTGDPAPILRVYKGEKSLVCEICKQPKVVIALKNDETEIICECILNKEEEE